MIRKNAVESILAERDILISVRNPFVVSRSSCKAVYLNWKFISCFNLNGSCIRFGSSIHLHAVRTCTL